jgi:hypothetical protein
MNVGELREALEDLDDEVEIRLATQPNWPLAFNIRAVVTPADIVDYRETEDETEVEDETEDELVWIVAGDHPWDGSPYAPRVLWNV